MDDAASASGVSTMTNDEDEAVQLLGQPGREQEIDSDFERELAQLVGGTPAGKFPTPLRIAVDLERAESIPTQFPFPGVSNRATGSPIHPVPAILCMIGSAIAYVGSP